MSFMLNKSIIIGFLFGFIGTPFVAMLGLIFLAVEKVGKIFLAPGRFILSPIMPYFAEMPGLFNILVFAIINGIIYAFLFYMMISLGRRKFK